MSDCAHEWEEKSIVHQTDDTPDSMDMHDRIRTRTFTTHAPIYICAICGATKEGDYTTCDCVADEPEYENA